MSSWVVSLNLCFHISHFWQISSVFLCLLKTSFKCWYGGICSHPLPLHVNSCSMSRQWALPFVVTSRDSCPRCLSQLLCLFPHSHCLWINKPLRWSSSELALWGPMAEYVMRASVWAGGFCSWPLYGQAVLWRFISRKLELKLLQQCFQVLSVWIYTTWRCMFQCCWA